MIDLSRNRVSHLCKILSYANKYLCYLRTFGLIHFLVYIKSDSRAVKLIKGDFVFSLSRIVISSIFALFSNIFFPKYIHLYNNTADALFTPSIKITGKSNASP